MRTRLHSLSLASALLLAACAAQRDVPDTTPVAGGASAPPPAPATVADVRPAAAGYKLTADEQKLDCNKLTGQMKLRMANMKSAFAAPTGTTTSRAIQNVTTPVFGGTQRGASQLGDLENDRAKLEAFNARLVEKKCKPLDIDAELRGAAPAKAPAPATKPAQKATG